MTKEELIAKVKQKDAAAGQSDRRICRNPMHTEHNGRFCQCADCRPTNGCPGCDECEGPVTPGFCTPTEE